MADTSNVSFGNVLQLSGKYSQRSSFGWQVDLPAELEPLTDNSLEPRRSPLVLSEDGRPLGPAHALHDDILNRGDGAYSFWRGNLYFSTSDGSDPNHNGRIYTVSLTNEAAVSPRSARVLLELAEFRQDRALCFVAPLAEFAEGDSLEQPYRSPLVLFEDAVACGPAHSAHVDIQTRGEGRYSHWHRSLYFSTSDNSDPRSNGRKYHAYMAEAAGQNLAITHAIESLRRLPADYRIAEAYEAIEDALAALCPSMVLGDPEKAYFDDQVFVERHRRVCGNNRRTYERKYTVYQLIKSLAHLPGELAECGTRNGETAYFMAVAGQDTGRERPLHVFDSFEGLSQPNAFDGSAWSAGALRGSQAQFAANLAEFHDVHIYEGWIPSRFADVADRRFCFVHIDVDLHDPTRDSLAFFYPRLIPGGMLLCDDYGSKLCPGARKAMDDFLPTSRNIL